MPLQEQDHILIEQHLLKQLSESDKLTFEMRLSDPDFKKELDLQKDLRIAFKSEGRDQLKKQLQNFEENIQKKPTEKVALIKTFSIGRILAVAVSIAVILTAVYWISNQGTSGEQLFAQHFKTYPNVIAPISKSVPNANKEASAFQAYELKNYQEAIELLGALPQNESTYFYIGLSKLSVDQAPEAITYFDKIKNKDNPFYVPANWYSALAFLKLDNKAAVKKHCAIVLEYSNTKALKKLAEDLLKDLE